LLDAEADNIIFSFNVNFLVQNQF